jgi:hypothetical protein
VAWDALVAAIKAWKAAAATEKAVKAQDVHLAAQRAMARVKTSVLSLFCPTGGLLTPVRTIKGPFAKAFQAHSGAETVTETKVWVRARDRSKAGQKRAVASDEESDGVPSVPSSVSWPNFRVYCP